MSSTNTKEISNDNIDAIESNTDGIETLLDSINTSNGIIKDSIEHMHVGGIMYDAFNRLRVSNPVTLFESKQIISDQPLLWDTAQVSGSGGSYSYSQARASTMMFVSANTACRMVRRTRRCFNYQPGKGHFIMMSAILGPEALGINRNVGYFDDANGVFFGVNHESLYCALRSSVTGSPVTILAHQSDWNKDKLDGTGPSGLVLNTSLTQIYWFDLEWLGVGRIRYGIFHRGIPILIHEFNFANEPGSTSVYMSSPALPMSYELINDGTGGATSIEPICCGLLSEGGQLINGIARSVSRGNTPITVSSANLVPILSIRTKAGLEFTTVNILSLEAATTDAAYFRWALVLNPTLNGSDSASWVALANSAIEYDISRTATNYITAGTIIDEGYVSNQARHTAIKPSSFLGLGKRLLGSSPKDQFVLAVQSVTGNNNNYYGALQFEESV